MRISLAIMGSDGPTTPYVQRVEYHSTVQAGTHTMIFTNTPINGNLLCAFVYDDLGVISTPAGWTLAATQTVSTQQLRMFHKIAGASEPTNVAFSVAPNSICCIIGYEFAGFSIKDDNGTIVINENILTNDIINVLTSVAVDIVLCAACYYLNANATEGPFTFGQGFIQLGYTLAPANGTSGKPIEMVVGFLRTLTAGTYHCQVTTTNTEALAGVTAPGGIIAFK